MHQLRQESDKPEPPNAIWALLRPAVWRQFLRQTWLNIRSAKVHYALGFFACCLVVVVVAVLISLLNQTPVIFLRLAETSRSEIDLKLDAFPASGFSRFNYTLAKSLLTDADEQFTSPRLSKSRYFIRVPDNCPYSHPNDPSWLYQPKTENNCINTCPNINCDNSRSAAVMTHILDLKQERKILVGRNWKLSDDLGMGEAYISSTLASTLNAPVGTTIWGRFNASMAGRAPFQDTVLQYACPDCRTNATKAFLADLAWVPFKVKDIFSDVAGKFPKDSDSYIVLIDHHTIMEHVARHLNPFVLGPSTSELVHNYTKTKMDDYVGTIILNLPPPRLQMYLTSKYSVIHDRLIHFSNKILFKLGYAQVYADMPVLRGLAGTEMVSMFLGLILNVIIFILLFLCIVLIYSLLMISVETRTFEMGILRMIGMARPSLIALLLTQAFAYAIPAWTIGSLIALGVYAAAASAVTTITKAAVQKTLTADAFGLATLIGLLVPVAASILPIRAALGQNLQDSLDVKHNKTKAVEITLKRGEAVDSGTWTSILIGFGLSLFGGIIYYVLPFGLLSANLPLLMNVFLFILIGMLLGLVMVALNLQHILERSLGWLFFFWESRGIRNLVVKNLVAHRKRNQKTSILYALSLGFIIFINIAYNVQVSSISEDKKRDAGAFMYAQSWGNIDPTTGQVPGLYNKDLEDVKLLFPNVVEDVAWVTRELRDAYPTAVNIAALNLGRWNTDTLRVYGVSPNFFRVAYSSYVLVKSQANTTMSAQYLPDALYTREGASKALFGSLYKQYLGIEPHQPMLLQSEESSTNTPSDGTNSGGALGGGLGNSGGSGTTTSSSSSATTSTSKEFLASAEAFLDSAPHFTFSAFPLVKGQDLMVSLPTFRALSNNYWKSVEEIPMSSFLLKINPKASKQQLDDVHEWMSEQLWESNRRVWDYRTEMEPFEVANRAIAYFFTFTTVVAMAISFFSLMSSMYTNIKEQTKEIGVIRALGIPKSWVYRIYIYEAFLLVVASSLLGIIIGTITSYTMNSQQSLFTQLPLAFNFPYVLLAVVLLCSLVFSLLSAWSPIRAVLRHRIVQILRGQ